MNKVDFSIMREPLQIFDTDSIDIGRRQTIINPDGTEGETNPTTPLYIDIPCHITFETIDNPDSATVDTDPVISVMTISCDVSVDLQNNDYITARVQDVNGNVLETYTGSIGFPEIVAGRKSAKMAMRKDV